MNMTRRYFLKSSGVIAAYCGLAPLDIFAQAGITGVDPQTVTKGKTLVVIFLRGGMDGLNFIVPYKDPGYSQIRHSIAIGAPGSPGGALDLDGFFGLHPKAEALLPLFSKGQAMGLHAVGYDLNTRSHFEEQDTWETGVTGNTVSSDGWLNRHLATSKGRGPVRAVALGDNLPRILRGDAPAYALQGVADLALPAGSELDPNLVTAALEHAYCTHPKESKRAAQDLLAQTARTTLDGIEILKKTASQPYNPKTPYPKTDLGRRLQEVAKLIHADVGLEVAEVDYGGWDTHQNQGGGAGDSKFGNFGTLVEGLAQAVAAFTEDLSDRMDDVLLLTLSDFGRTAKENGTAGTDHGWANCMLAVGGGVIEARKQGGKPVLTKWPGLKEEQLHQNRDLLHTTDFRDVLGEVVSVHLGNPDLKTILPQHDFKPVGFVANPREATT